jgi:hypothetical protein
VNRIISFVGGLVVGALVFGAIGLLFGYEIAERDTPALVVSNLTDDVVTQLVVHSDRESRPIGSLSARASRRVSLSTRHQSPWLTGSVARGTTMESEHVYVTTKVAYFAAIFAGAIVLVPAS